MFHVKHSALSPGLDTQPFALFKADGVGAPRCQFQNTVRRDLERGDTPWCQMFADFQHAQIAVQCDRIDGESHAQGMNRACWHDPHACIGWERTPSLEANEARQECVRDAGQADDALRDRVDEAYLPHLFRMRPK